MQTHAVTFILFKYDMIMLDVVLIKHCHENVIELNYVSVEGSCKAVL